MFKQECAFKILMKCGFSMTKCLQKCPVKCQNTFKIYTRQCWYHNLVPNCCFQHVGTNILVLGSEPYRKHRHKASLMSEEKLAILLNVFGSLKQKVLWKWETDTMKDKPENVMLYKWLPQQDVLGHPNVKMFVSHGGQSSFQETLCHQKPAVSQDYKVS